MKITAASVTEYLDNVPPVQQEPIRKLRDVIIANLPEGFVEQMSYGMIGYVVPLAHYPRGYHVKKNEPLPFMALAAQKNHLALYHMGLYGNQAVMEWFVKAYEDQVKTRLDLGKSCIRFKNNQNIPYGLIGDLVQRIPMAEYLATYEKSRGQKHGR